MGGGIVVVVVVGLKWKISSCCWKREDIINDPPPSPSWQKGWTLGNRKSCRNFWDDGGSTLQSGAGSCDRQKVFISDHTDIAFSTELQKLNYKRTPVRIYIVGTFSQGDRMIDEFVVYPQLISIVPFPMWKSWVQSVDIRGIRVLPNDTVFARLALSNVFPFADYAAWHLSFDEGAELFSSLWFGFSLLCVMFCALCLRPRTVRFHSWQELCAKWSIVPSNDTIVRASFKCIYWGKPRALTFSIVQFILTVCWKPFSASWMLEGKKKWQDLKLVYF